MSKVKRVNEEVKEVLVQGGGVSITIEGNSEDNRQGGCVEIKGDNDTYVLCKVRGEYYTYDKRAQKRYRISVSIPNKTEYINKLMSFLRGDIIPPILKENYPDSKGLRTMELEEVRYPEGYKGDRYIEDKNELVMRIKEAGWNINTELYETALSLKSAIRRYLQDSNMYYKEEEVLRNQLVKRENMGRIKVESIE